MKVGVLALQGDVPEHLSALSAVVPDHHLVSVRRPVDLAAVDALFLPGGESTTIARLLQKAGLWEPLGERARAGMPVLATCAGLILLSRTLVTSPSGINPPTLDLLDIEVRRNDYGAQRESFEGDVRVDGLRGAPFHGVFIRAPRILGVGRGATPIAWWNDEVVGVRQGSVWGLTFHPELSPDRRLHRLFLADATRLLSATKGRARPARA
jgi:pyridoxal 5'-phosphate synthase pdxT subunit